MTTRHCDPFSVNISIWYYGHKLVKWGEQVSPPITPECRVTLATYPVPLTREDVCCEWCMVYTGWWQCGPGELFSSREEPLVDDASVQSVNWEILYDSCPCEVSCSWPSVATWKWLASVFPFSLSHQSVTKSDATAPLVARAACSLHSRTSNCYSPAASAFLNLKRFSLSF